MIVFVVFTFSVVDDQVYLIPEYFTGDVSSISDVIHHHLQCRGEVSKKTIVTMYRHYSKCIGTYNDTGARITGNE